MHTKKPHGSLISYFSKLAKSTDGINLAQGKPGFSPPEKLLQILENKIHSEKQLHQYAPGIGDPELLRVLSDFYAQPVENLLILQGATEGLSLTFFYLTTILTGNYSVLSFDPPYESYPELARLYGLRFVYFDYDENLSIDFDKLESHIKQKNVKVVFIASPGNPLGRIWTKDELETIDRLSRKYGFYIIFDTVYKDIFFDRPCTLPLYLQNENLFFVDSFSKMLSITGWRIGYLIAHKKHMIKIRAIHDYIGLCAPYLFQRAIADYLQKYGFGKEYTNSIRESCRRNYTFLRQGLANLGFKCPNIEGGYFLWAELPLGISDGFQFASELYQKVNVAVVPGENFSPTKKNFVRLNFTVKFEILEKALLQISHFLNDRHQDSIKHLR